MSKLHDNDSNLSRAKKHSETKESKFKFPQPWKSNDEQHNDKLDSTGRSKFIKWFKREKPELIDMTFDSKRKQGLQVNKKKIALYIALGIMVASAVGASIVPIIQQFNAPAPKQEVGNKTINDVLSTTSTTTADETSTTTTTTDATTTTINAQDEIDKKVKDEVEKERAKLADEYNKKLDEATKSVQDANSELAKVKSERDALQKQIDEFKSKSDQSSQSGSRSSQTDRVDVPQN